MPNERDRETSFLRRCLRHDTSGAGSKLEERMRRFQRDERSLRRVSHLTAIVAVLAAAGLLYGAFFSDDFPFRMSLFTSRFVVEALGTLGIAALICLLAFSGVWFLYRKEVNRCRARGRLLIAGLLESRPPDTHSQLHEGRGEERRGIAPAGTVTTSALEKPNPPKSGPT